MWEMRKPGLEKAAVSRAVLMRVSVRRVSTIFSKFRRS